MYIVRRSILPLDFECVFQSPPGPFFNLHQLTLCALSQLNTLEEGVKFRGERILDGDHAANFEPGCMLGPQVFLCVCVWMQISET